MLYSQKSMFLMGLLSALSPSVMGMKRPIAGSSSLRRRLPGLGQIIKRIHDPFDRKNRSNVRHTAPAVDRPPARLTYEQASQVSNKRYDPLQEIYKIDEGDHALVDLFLKHQEISDEEFQRRMIMAPHGVEIGGRKTKHVFGLNDAMTSWCRGRHLLGQKKREASIANKTFNRSMRIKFFSLHFKQEPWLISFSEEAEQTQWKAYWKDVRRRELWLQMRYKKPFGETVVGAYPRMFDIDNKSTRSDWDKAIAEAIPYAKLLQQNRNRIKKEDMLPWSQDYTKDLYREKWLARGCSEKTIDEQLSAGGYYEREVY